MTLRFSHHLWRCVAIWPALALAVGASTETAEAQDTGDVTGRVVVTPGGGPVSGAIVRVDDYATLRDITDEQGRFGLRSVPAGDHVLVVERVGHASLTRAISLGGGEELELTLELGMVTELRIPRIAPPQRSSARLLVRADIEAGALQGLDLVELIVRAMPSVRAREEGLVGGGTCVEFRGGAPGSVCRQLGLVVDGVQSQSPSFTFRSIALSNLERIELLAPGEAGTRYGGVGGWGMLIVQTRRGPSDFEAAETPRLVSGFDWTGEPRPYAWTKVLLSTAVVNSVTLGVTYSMNDCLRLSRRVRYVAIRTECGSWGTVGSVFLMTFGPSLASSLTARWAGATPRSRGRFGPSTVIGTALTIGGYVALLYGNAEDSAPASIAGITVLTVGTPLLLTLGDRLLRELR